MPRPYQMKRRTESAEETRQRIVRATYELHTEKGVAATSIRDIAQRADVAVGSVYHHFPTYDDVVSACGSYTLALAPLPDATIFEGIATPAARLRALVEAMFAFYARLPGFERVRAERDRFAQLDEFVRSEEANRRALLAAALMTRKPPKRRLMLAYAMLDVVVYRTLVSGGVEPSAAAQELTSTLQQLLLGASTTSPA